MSKVNQDGKFTDYFMREHLKEKILKSCLGLDNQAKTNQGSTRKTEILCVSLFQEKVSKLID